MCVAFFGFDMHRVFLCQTRCLAPHPCISDSTFLKHPFENGDLCPHHSSCKFMNLLPSLSNGHPKSKGAIGVRLKGGTEGRKERGSREAYTTYHHGWFTFHDSGIRSRVLAVVFVHVDQHPGPRAMDEGQEQKKWCGCYT